MGESNTIEVLVLEDHERLKQVTVHNRTFIGGPGGFAMELIKCAWAIGLPDGDSSNGATKVKLMTPAELVARSVEVATITWSKFRELGWLVEAPPVADLRRRDSGQAGFRSE